MKLPADVVAAKDRLDRADAALRHDIEDPGIRPVRLIQTNAISGVLRGSKAEGIRSSDFHTRRSYLGSNFRHRESRQRC